MLAAYLHCFARLDECPHDEDVARGAMITPEPSLASSSESMFFSPATYASLQHCSIQLGQNSAHCNAAIIV